MKNIKNSCGSEGCDARKLTLPYLKRNDKFINRLNSNGRTKFVYSGVHERRNDIRKVSFMASKAMEKKAA